MFGRLIDSPKYYLFADLSIGFKSSSSKILECLRDRTLRLVGLCFVGHCSMQMRVFTVGPVSTNCYVIWCDRTSEGIVIDPGFTRQDEGERILKTLIDNGLHIKFIVDTHGHADHTSGNGVVKKAASAPIVIHKLDAHMLTEEGKKRGLLFGIHVDSPLADSYLKDGDVVTFGDVDLQVLHTPGHSPGSVSLIGDKVIFTGDTLFAGSIGRVDLLGGSAPDIKKSLKKLMVLPGSLIVYPGHGPRSTIEKERLFNPFVIDFSLIF